MINKHLLCCVTALCFVSFSCSNTGYDSYTGAVYNNKYNQTPDHYPKSYQQYGRPNSGTYRNPYQSPPRNYYPYYDHDYYYVPPINYRNTEPSTYGGPDTTKY